MYRSKYKNKRGIRDEYIVGLGKNHHGLRSNMAIAVSKWEGIC